MALAVGGRIGHYEILAFAGAGGMGEVYRAHDSRLQRDVALKLLPDHFASDPERCARLEREAQVLASLNHPHIAQVYGLERADGLSCIVMELVEGPTLADRIAAVPSGLPLEEVLSIAQQIVTALEAAHGRGVVHRDLKPANIKTTSQGETKILDFGLATIAARVPAGMSGGLPVNVTNSPTVMTGTMPGVIMGTLAYMSPEQARGTVVDSRTDVWAFGCVLYEMLTGRPAFSGDTPTDVVAKIVTTSPDWDQLPPRTPAAIRQLLRATFDRDPRKRLQHIGDARLFLDAPAEPQVGPPAAASNRFGWPVAAASVAVAVLAGVTGWWLGNRTIAVEPHRLVHLTAALPDDASGLQASIAVSADGSRLAFNSGGRLFIRDIADDVVKPVRGAARTAPSRPSFSPTGDQLAFISADGVLKKIAVSGGTAVDLGRVNAAGALSWGKDGNILVALAAGGIVRVPAEGGSPHTVVMPDPGEQYTRAELLPGGRFILATITTGADTASLSAVDAQTGRKTVLVTGLSGGPFGTAGTFVPTGGREGVGHVVYSSDTGLFAAAFDVDTLRVGPATKMLDAGAGREIVFAVSPSGALVYLQKAQNAAPRSTLAWVDRQGGEQPVPMTPPDAYSSPRLSRDGNRLAIVIRRDENFGGEIDVLDLTRPARIKVTFTGQNSAPLWDVRSNRLIYRHSESGRGGSGLRAVVADGSGTTELWSGLYIPYSISLRDSIVIASTPSFVRGRRDNSAAPPPANGTTTGSVGLRGRGGAPNGNRLWLLKLGSDGKAANGPQPFLDADFFHENAEFSPDGRWIAFQSNQNQANGFEVYVLPFPGPGELIPISVGGAEEPRWNSNGRELFYRNGDKLMAVDVTTGPEFRVTRQPHLLFEKAALGYDVAPDGKRFLMLKPVVTGTTRQELDVLLNWVDELRRRVPLESR